MRGLVAFDVALRTGRIDLHSGQWGGTVPNAALVAARLVCVPARRPRAGHPPRLLRPGAAAVSPLEQASLDAQPFDEAPFLAQAGVAYLEGEDGLQRRWSGSGSGRPPRWSACAAATPGPGIKTIVPATAGFKVALPPGARPAARRDQPPRSSRGWPRRCPPGSTVTVTARGGGGPGADPDRPPGHGRAGRAIERVWGRPPLFTREGGSGPEEALGRVLDAPVLFLGVGLPDDRIHAPNERMVMDQFWKGLLAAGELLVELGGTDAQTEARRGKGATDVATAVPPVPLSGPRRTPDAHEWVSFEDPDEERTWVFDVTFLLSRWSCIFGAGLPGRAHRAGPRAGAGLLLLRGPFHR